MFKVSRCVVILESRILVPRSLQQRPDNDAAMEDAPQGSSVVRLEDATGIEPVLWNISLGGYK
jgi:hypothetical protein